MFIQITDENKIYYIIGISVLILILYIYFSNGKIAVYNWYGYRFASQTAPQDYLNYWVKFYDKTQLPEEEKNDI